MKKVLLLIVLCLIIPINVHAEEYAVRLSGEDIIQTYDSFGEGKRSMFIDIDNYKEIASAMVYIKYDRDVLSPALCGERGFRAEGCWVSSDENRIVIFDYNGVDELNGNHLYYVVFKALENVEEGTTTTVEVWLEDAKDKDGNDIVVSSATKTYTLKYVWPKYNQDSSSDESVENNSDTIVSNDNSSTTGNNNSSNTNSNTNTNSNSNTSVGNNSANNDSVNSSKEVNSDTDTDNEDVEDSVLVSEEIAEEIEEKEIDSSNEKELEEEKEEKKTTDIDKKYLIIGGVVLGIIIIISLVIWYRRYKKEEELFNQI